MNDPLLLHRRILLPTDFSSGAARARDYAVFLAQIYGAELRLLHVSQPYPTLTTDAVAEPYLLEPVRQQVSRVMDELSGRLREAGIQASGMQTIGIPSEEIIRTAREEGADIIVMGTQGRTGLDHVLVGSTAERVVKGAPCPVMTVRPSSNADSQQVPITVQRLLVPVDFSDSSVDVLEVALHVARRLGASVTLLHVVEWAWLRLQFTVAELAESDRVRTEMESRLGQYADLLRAQGLRVETVMRGGGGPGDFIVETAEQQRSDLIIMGTHGRRGIRRALIGSVAEAVLRAAPCPVLTVMKPRFAPAYVRVLTTVGHAA